MPSSDSIQASISGNIWWGGFTAAVTLTNNSSKDLENWSYSFDSPHQINTAPWGAKITSVPLQEGFTRYTLTGENWGERIPSGQSITVGFNGTQGINLGIEGQLTTEDLMMPNASFTEQSDTDEQGPIEISSEEFNTAINNIENSSDSMLTNVMTSNGMESDEGMNHAMHQNGSAHHEENSDYIDITSWGTFHSSNHNSEHNELVGGRTAITTEAMVAYNGLRNFAGLEATELEKLGEWAFANGLTNNSQGWGNDTKGVGLWYAMQGAKVGWIADDLYQPQILADIQRTARMGSEADAMTMVREYGHEGFADYIEANSLQDAFVNTLKMEPHYGGWMHGRTHGYLNIENVAIAHDINHLTVLGWDQEKPFMNDTFDWPQWPALDVSDQTVINYYQGIVSLGDPMSQNLEQLATEIVQADNPTIADNPGVLQRPIIEENAIDQLTNSQLEISVSGDLWWQGLTAEITVTNTSNQNLDDWSVTFESSHESYGEAWGAELTIKKQDESHFLYELSGNDWGQSIDAGQSITVGFNAMQGEAIGNNGILTSEAFFLDLPVI
jgi:endoglucanase